MVAKKKLPGEWDSLESLNPHDEATGGIYFQKARDVFSKHFSRWFQLEKYVRHIFQGK